jgi:hypothetical protein
MTNTHRDTIMRLMVEVGTGCAALANDQMRILPCKRIQVDEIWSFVGKKQMHPAPMTASGLAINGPLWRSTLTQSRSRRTESVSGLVTTL